MVVAVSIVLVLVLLHIFRRLHRSQILDRPQDPPPSHIGLEIARRKELIRFHRCMNISVGAMLFDQNVGGAVNVDVANDYERGPGFCPSPVGLRRPTR